LLATTPKVAQRFGAGTHSEIGPIVRQALWLALVVGLMATGILFSAEPVLRVMKVDPELIGPCMQYLHGIASGLPAVAIYHVLRCFSDGLGRTRPAMVLGLCGLALNILNYIFIYGHFGVPAMGGVGCGWATAIVMWVMALGWPVGSVGRRRTSRVRMFSRFDWPQWAVIKRLLGIGLPIGIAVFAESSILP
jgi:MATE family multidrug resistance protein